MRIDTAEGTAFGAALLAQIHAGVWPSVEAASDGVVRAVGRYEEACGACRALYPALRASFAALFGVEEAPPLGGGIG